MSSHHTQTRTAPRGLTPSLIAPSLIAPSLIALTLLTLGLGACTGVRTRRTDLRDAVHDYNIAVRWGHVQKASTFIPTATRAQFMVRKRQAMARMKIHEVSIRHVRILKNNARAVVLVQLAFSIGADPIIRNHMVEQRWSYLDTQWLLVSRKRVQASATARAPQPGDLY